MEPFPFLAHDPGMGFAQAVRRTAETLISIVEPTQDGPIQSTWSYEPGTGVIQPEQFCALTVQNVGFARLPGGTQEIALPEALDFMVSALYPVVEDDPDVDGLYAAQIAAEEGYGHWFDTLVADQQINYRFQWADATAGRVRGLGELGVLLYAYESDVRVRLH